MFFVCFLLSVPETDVETYRFLLGKTRSARCPFQSCEAAQWLSGNKEISANRREARGLSVSDRKRELKCIYGSACSRQPVIRILWVGGKKERKKQFKVVRRCLGKQFNIKLSEVQWQFEFRASTVQSLFTIGPLVVVCCCFLEC